MTPLNPIAPGEVSGPYAATLVRAARQAGIPLAALAQAVDRPPERLMSLPERLPTRDYLALMAAGARVDSCFGLRVGQAVEPGSFPVLGYTLMSCRNTAEVMEQVLRFEGLNHDLGQSSLHVENDWCQYEWRPNPCYLPDPAHPLYRHVVDSVMAGLHTFVPWLLARRVPLHRVELACAQPPEAGAHKALFGVPVVFGADTNRLVCSAEILSWPVRSTDPALFETLQAQARRLLEAQREQHDQDVVARLREALLAGLQAGDVRAESIARRMNLSVRSLQRRLGERGTRYQAVLDALRRELAETHLSRSRHSISDIAWLLGYREQSSFNHAFREWTGLTPTQFRRGETHCGD